MPPGGTSCANCNNHRDRDDASALAYLHVGGIDPHVRPAAPDRTAEECNVAHAGRQGRRVVAAIISTAFVQTTNSSTRLKPTCSPS